MNSKQIKGYRSRLTMFLIEGIATTGSEVAVDLRTIEKLIEICDELIQMKKRRKQPDEDRSPHSVTHQCIHKVHDEHYDVGVTKGCPATRTADGEFHNLCGEPCRWIMIKEGEGNPPWLAGAEAGNGLCGKPTDRDIPNKYNIILSDGYDLDI